MKWKRVMGHGYTAETRFGMSGTARAVQWRLYRIGRHWALGVGYGINDDRRTPIAYARNLPAIKIRAARAVEALGHLP